MRLPARRRLRDRLLDAADRPSASSRARIRRRHQAAVPDRDQRQRAAGDRPRHVGDVQLLPPRLQEPDLVATTWRSTRRTTRRSPCRTRSAATRSPLYNLNPAKASARQHPRSELVVQLPQVHRLRRQLQQPDARADAVRRREHRAPDRRTPARWRIRTSCATAIRAALGIPYYTQIKINGSYQLPWQLSVSGTLQSYPGDARNSTVDGSTALNNGTILAEDPSLRVDLDRRPARCSGRLTGQTLTQSSINVPLNAPGTKLLDRRISSTSG